MSTFSELPAERLSRCLEMAASARASAASAAFPETREIYIGIALAWEALAVEVQGMSGTYDENAATWRFRGPEPPPSPPNAKLTLSA